MGLGVDGECCALQEGWSACTFRAEIRKGSKEEQEHLVNELGASAEKDDTTVVDVQRALVCSVYRSDSIVGGHCAASTTMTTYSMVRDAVATTSRKRAHGGNFNLKLVHDENGVPFSLRRESRYTLSDGKA